MVAGIDGDTEMDWTPFGDHVACNRPYSADTVEMEVEAPRAQALCGVPEDCFVHVLRSLSAEELRRCACVSREFHRLSGQDMFWQKLCIEDYGASSEVLLECYKEAVLSGPTFWKRMYRELRHYRIALEFTAGPRSGDRQEIKRQQECSLGRSRQNMVCILHDEMVSRKHAKIRVIDKHFCIQDVGGINRTFINQRVIPQHVDTRLYVSDQVDMGSSCVSSPLTLDHTHLRPFSSLFFAPAPSQYHRGNRGGGGPGPSALAFCRFAPAREKSCCRR